jgi:hypothetical protein
MVDDRMHGRGSAGLRALGLAIVGGLLAAAPAAATSTIYTVTGLGDQSTGPGCVATGPNASTCPTLRNAVDASNADGVDSDSIMIVPEGTITLSQGSLGIAADMSIFGTGARTTTLQAAGDQQTILVGAGVTTQLVQLTIQGGDAGTGYGGNILSAGDLLLSQVRVTGGHAWGGGGIANFPDSTLTLTSSLVDGNTADDTGGGIISMGNTFNGSHPATLIVHESTIAGNHATNNGGGIRVEGNADNESSVIQSTIARNTGGGIAVADSAVLDLVGSIVASNTGANCAPAAPHDGGFNLEDRSDCGLSAASSRSGADPGLSATLVNMGGDTNVLTIPASSPAVDIVNPCLYPLDQRGSARYEFTAEGMTIPPCDAGAYEQSSAGHAQPTPTPTPTPPPTTTPAATATPAPAPTPTATPIPTPVAGKTVVVKPTGKVLVRRPGTNTFVALTGAQSIPVGSTVDTTGGSVQLTSQPKAGAPGQTATFFDGQFKVTQSHGITNLTLNEALAPCKTKGKASAAAKKKPKTRKLWGDGSGAFSTSGQYSAATVRGTKWLVQDSCAGTLTKVSRGVVSVRDNVRHKTIILKAGKSYLAKPRG